MEPNCIFCKIIAGTIPAHKVYEDGSIFAFLDINPTVRGHTLVIPKSHHAMLADTPDPVVADVFVKAKSLMVTLKSAMKADYVALSVVGTDVPHLHIHLLPRKKDDGLANFWPTKKLPTEEMDMIRDTIQQALK